jgi:NADPH-dependent curcumin reductase CurA
MTSINRQWLLAKRPQGHVTEECFELFETEIPALEDGQILIQNHYFAFEPAMRGWIDDAPNYLPPV